MDELLNLKDCCKILKISRPTIVEMIKKKKLRATKVGIAYRIRRSDLEKYLESNVIK